MYDPDLSAFYRIQEGTTDEYVAVGSDGNILRWAPTAGDEQKWLIVPVRDSVYHVRTKSNGEYMAVGHDGNVRRWAVTGQKEQEFRLLPKGSERYEIKEGTKNECVAVGSNGNVLRWACNGGKEQEFRLLPEAIGTKPEVRPGEAEPGEIGDVPRIAGFGQPPPERSAPKLIGEALIPAVYIHEPGIDPFEQMRWNRPYYVLRREQFWDRGPERGAYLEHDGHTERTVKITTKVGIKNTTSQSIEDTLGVKVSVNAKFNYSGQSAEIGTEISKTLKVTQTTSQERMVEETHEETVNFPRGDRFVRAIWTMVDRYTLERAVDGSPVDTWEIALNAIIMDSFPRD